MGSEGVRRELDRPTVEPSRPRPPAHVTGDDGDRTPCRPPMVSVSTVRALQRRAGNAAVARLAAPSPSIRIVQRQPGGAETQTSEISPDDARYVATEVQRDFYALYRGLMSANTIGSHTHFRDGLMRQLDAIGMDAAVDRGVFTDPERHMDAIATISERLHDVTAELASQHAYALRLWTWFDGQVKLTQAQLQLGTAAEQHASAILGETYGRAKQRVQGLGTFAVAEDFAHGVDMLKRQSHLALGSAQAAREEQQLARESAALASDLADAGDDGPGFWSTVWGVVGWDSPTDFLADVALTAATLGANKYLRGAKRGKKALDAAKAARGARKLKYLKRAKQLDAVKDVSEKLVVAVAQHQAEIQSLTKWARANARGLLRKLATDLSSDQATGGVRGVPSTVVSRLTKGYLQVVVDELLNVSEEQAKRYVELSHIALFAGKEDSHRRLIRAFLSIAVRRRGLTNLVHSTISRTLRLEVPADLRAVGVDVGSIALTTAREVINDFVNGLPYVDRYRGLLVGPIEFAFKSLEKAVQGELGR